MRRFPHALALALLVPLSVLLGVPEAAAASAATPGDPPPVPRRLILNEVDYDQPGVDTGEFVEIVNAGRRAVRLRNVDLILVNGTTAAEYRRVPLTGRLDAGRRLVVATPEVRVPDRVPTLVLPLARDNLQNGSPDALALFDRVHEVLVDAISYEGAIEAATFNEVAGTWPLVTGSPVSESDGNETAGSICRLPDGANAGDDDEDWGACSPTAGRTNSA